MGCGCSLPLAPSMSSRHLGTFRVGGPAEVRAWIERVRGGGGELVRREVSLDAARRLTKELVEVRTASRATVHATFLYPTSAGLAPAGQTAVISPTPMSGRDTAILLGGVGAFLLLVGLGRPEPHHRQARSR